MFVALCELLVGACGGHPSDGADVSCSSPPPAPKALGPTSGLEGRIVWASNRADGNMDLYAMTAEGRGVRRLTDAPATEIAPVWSPDGTKIAFLSFQEAFDSVDAEVSPGQIKIMDADGSNVRELTAPEPQTGGITWAPDGDRIAFAAPGGQIDVIRVDGSERRRLAKVGRAAYGTHIAFTADRCGRNSEIYITDTRGARVLNATHHPALDLFPSWHG